MRVAVIPARGGSKRIPRKNIRNFSGRPIIAWSIEAALRAGCFDLVVCSTDDEEIATVATAAGASVPFRRPPALADDFTGTTAVIAHAIDELELLGHSPSMVCCLYPTAPFIQPMDLIASLEMLESDELDYVFPVTPYEYPVQRCLRRSAGGHIQMREPEFFHVRSQDLEECFHDAGLFYWGRANAWREGKVIFSSRSASILLPGSRVRDIDTEDDWVIAELLFQALRSSSLNRFGT